MFLSIKIHKPRFFLPFAIVIASMSMASCAVAPATETTHTSSINNTNHTYLLSEGTPVIPDNFTQSALYPYRYPHTDANTASIKADDNSTQIVQQVRNKLIAPTGSPHTTVTTVVTITVDKQGYVTAVAADSNNAHARAAIAAVRAVGRFPIDSSDPKYPTFTITFRGSN